MSESDEAVDMEMLGSKNMNYAAGGALTGYMLADDADRTKWAALGAGAGYLAANYL